MEARGVPCGDTLSVNAAHIPALIERVIRRVPTRSHLWGSAWTLGVGPGGVDGPLPDTG